jgi:hypothetical protein
VQNLNEVVVTTVTAAGAAAAYGGHCVYEFVMWDNVAKERKFKLQFVAHVTNELRLIVCQTSANWSNQVEQ